MSTTRRDDIGNVALTSPRGTVQLAGASNVAVACPALTSNSLIFLTVRSPGGTLGLFWVSAINPGVGFSVASLVLNTSVLSWLVVEP